MKLNIKHSLLSVSSGHPHPFVVCACVRSFSLPTGILSLVKMRHMHLHIQSSSVIDPHQTSTGASQLMGLEFVILFFGTSRVSCVSCVSSTGVSSCFSTSGRNSWVRESLSGLVGKVASPAAAVHISALARSTSLESFSWVICSRRLESHGVGILK